MEKERKAILYQGVTGCILFFVMMGFAAPTQAAVFGFSSDKSAYEASDTLTVTVSLSSPTQVVNAVSGTITVPQELDVLSISQTGSIVGFWVQSPVFSVSARTVSFEGVILNPGFQGGFGSLFQIQLRANDSGTSAIKLQSGAILAHDGQGTNILETPTGMSVVVGTSAEGQEEADEENEGDQEETQDNLPNNEEEGSEQPDVDEAPTAPPRAPRLQSSTHPDVDAWYPAPNPLITWAVPSGLTAVRVGISRGATDAPTELRRGATGSYQVDEQEEGVWYVHVQLQNAVGWSPVAHYKIQIDTTAPTEIALQEVERKDLSNPDVQFRLSAEDRHSGVDQFAVRLDEAEEYTWVSDDTRTLTLSDVRPGVHGLNIRVQDKAGNTTSTDIIFFVDALEAPFLENVPGQLQVGEELTLHGRTRYPSSQVVLWLERKGQEALQFLATSDQNGLFAFTVRDRIPPGSYALSAEVVDARGAHSNRSQEFPLLIRRGVGEYLLYLVGILVVGMLLFAGLFWRERTMRGISSDIGKEEDELLDLAHRMRQKLRTLETRERIRRRKADRVLAKTEEEITEELGEIVQARKKRSA